MNIGYGNVVHTDKVLAVGKVRIGSGKRLAQGARDEGRSIDATQGRKTKGLIIMDNGYLVLSALLPETIAGRFNGPESAERFTDRGRQKMNKKGLILVLSGFSGVGKGTVVKRLMEQHEEYALSISVTTREPRAGEVHGKGIFITKEKFAELEANGGLILGPAATQAITMAPPGIMSWGGWRKAADHSGDRDPGALQIKKRYPEAVLIFVVPPDAETLKRLTGRVAPNTGGHRGSLKRAVEESQGMEQYEYLLVNDDLDTCVEEFHEIVQAERRKADRNQELINHIRTDLKGFVKSNTQLNQVHAQPYRFSQTP
ncbi:MAG: extracellular matrix/biofilm biosynthesis regulator RemA family protein [Lachnospiraceae bacterium]